MRGRSPRYHSVAVGSKRRYGAVGPDYPLMCKEFAQDSCNRSRSSALARGTE